MTELTSVELKHICDLVVKLTEIRVSQCNHLCIENFSSQLLEKLIASVIASKPKISFGINTEQQQRDELEAHNEKVKSKQSE